MTRAPARLVPRGEITPARFGELGRPYLVRRDHADRVALASSFDPLYWPGRALYAGHRLRHRLCIYTANLECRLAVFDDAVFPINDVAFHPSGPWVAIGCGSYDRGRAFEGQLLLWNWETNQRRSVLAVSREVVACRFVDAERLAVLLRPRDDEEYGDAEASEITVGVVLEDLRAARDLGLGPSDPDPRLADATPIDPGALGFAGAPARGLSEDELAWLARAGFEERHRIWDVAWLADDRVAAVHDSCHVEVWRLPDRRELDLRGAGHGVQLLRQPRRWLVHVLEPADGVAGPPVRSRLLALDGDAVVELQRFAHVYAFSVDRRGRILARDVGGRSVQHRRLDRVLDPDGAVVLETDLGHYDCFNHHVRIDGGEVLYFLRGTPPASHLAKHLCAIEGDGTVRELLLWDDRGAHLMEGSACATGDGGIVRAYRIYDPRPSEPRGAVDQRGGAGEAAGRRCDLGPGVTSLVATADGRHVIAALTSGRLVVLDPAGAVVGDQQVTADGLPTFITALALDQHRLIAGTIDGRLVCYDLVVR